MLVVQKSRCLDGEGERESKISRLIKERELLGSVTGVREVKSDW